MQRLAFCQLGNSPLHRITIPAPKDDYKSSDYLVGTIGTILILNFFKISIKSFDCRAIFTGKKNIFLKLFLKAAILFYLFSACRITTIFSDFPLKK